MFGNAQTAPAATCKVRTMKAHVTPALSCPLCTVQLFRVPRSLGDRLVGLFMPVRRFRCASAVCGWEGLLLRDRNERRADRYRDRKVLDAASASCSPVRAARRALP